MPVLFLGAVAMVIIALLVALVFWFLRGRPRYRSFSVVQPVPQGTPMRMEGRLIVVLVLGLFLCGGVWALTNIDWDPRPVTKPSNADLAGTYRTNDSRVPNAKLVLFADGHFELSGFPSIADHGGWKCERDSAGMWEMELNRASGFPVYGKGPPYQIGLFIGDPDEGAIIMRRSR